MKAFIAIQLLVTLLATATAADSVRGVRQLATAPPTKTSSNTFSRIRLTGSNEIAPFEGVDYVSGTADVKLSYNSSRSPKWRVCLNTTILDFTPGLLHIHKGKITVNGAVRVNFSLPSANGDDNFSFSRCVPVDELLYNDMRDNPVSQFRAVST